MKPQIPPKLVFIFLRVLDARLERLEIGELTVERLTILERTEVPPAT